MDQKLACPECGAEAVYKSGKELFGSNSTGSGRWACSKGCDCYVGCHKNSQVPLGTLANKKTRIARTAVHNLLDETYGLGRFGSLFGTRQKAYAWIQEALQISQEKAHIACFTENECLRLRNRLMQAIKEYFEQARIQY